MVDRNPIDNWTVGNVTLIGVSAHVTYSVDSNGVSQAIVDARKMDFHLLKMESIGKLY